MVQVEPSESMIDVLSLSRILDFLHTIWVACAPGTTSLLTSDRRTGRLHSLVIGGEFVHYRAAFLLRELLLDDYRMYRAF